MIYSKIVDYISLLTFSLLLSFNQNSFVSSSRIDCDPISGVSKDACLTLGCIWGPEENRYHDHRQLPFDKAHSESLVGNTLRRVNISEPWCYYPDDYVGYKLTEVSTEGSRAKLIRDRPSALPDDIKEITVEVENVGGSDGSLLRVKIYDSNKKRFEPELPKLNFESDQRHSVNQSKFKFEINNQGRLIIRRNSTEAVLFETDLKKLIFSDKFIQLNTKLASPFVYGLGEHYDTFLKLANDYKPYSFFNTDRLPLPQGQRSYGGFPFYINFDSDNQQNAHGVYLHNSNGMDVIIQPDVSITFRPIGGILDFIIFSGPTPNDVISQYQHLVGLPDLPPRWALGFHLCKYGYDTLEKTELVWSRNRDTGIPFDIQWNDIDNMERHNDFTYDKERFKGLPEFIEKLHDSNMHYMLLFDPGLSDEDNYYPYTLGQQMDIFVKNATNQTLIGKVWNDSGRTVFPDFSNPKSIDYWTQLFVKFQNEIKFDGAWIDMNDISNFVYGSLDSCPKENPLEQTPYKPGGYDLQHNTLCLSAKHMAGYEFDVHNLYSFYEAIATFKALEAARPGKRPFVISRSTAPGQGHYGGHWSGDVLSTWDYLRWSIPSLIEHSMYGFSMMGSDICGFTGNSNPELCARWSTLGAFYTFSRNHNDEKSIDQDPVALGPEVVEANRNALSKKYSLLPYLYSLIHRAHRFGEPVIRSVPFEFFRSDKRALEVEYQFMWGSGLMISPVVHENTYNKSTFLPKGRWYETGVKLEPSGHSNSAAPKWIDSKGEWHETKDIALTDIPLFYRGGHIFPVYPVVRQTTIETVQQDMGLEVALCEMFRGHGEIYLDDGDNIDDKYNHLAMKFENDKLTIEMDRDDFKAETGFGLVKIYGIAKQINDVRVNNEPIQFTRSDHMLSFSLMGKLVTKVQPLVVEFH